MRYLMLAPGVATENGLNLQLTKNYGADKGEAEKRGVALRNSRFSILTGWIMGVEVGDGR